MCNMKAIVAMDENRGIGIKGKIPWHIPQDFKWFKEFTMGKNLLVGWKTFRTLPVLNGRTIWVVDSGAGDIQSQPVTNDNQSIGYLWQVQPEHLHLTKDNLINGIYKDYIVVGGAKTYALFMPYITEFYVTHVKGKYNADVFMNPFEDLFPYRETVKEFDGHWVMKYSKSV